MKAAGISHIGKIRNNNEDAYYLNEQHKLIAVADGMGGHKAGEIASGIAIEAVASLIATKNQASIMPAEVFRRVFADANKRIWNKSHETEDCKGMGTTLTAVWIVEDLAYVAHIGDSRAYLIHEGTIRQITRDHTLVEELIKSGTIDRASALSHPQKNVLMKAVGADDGVSPDIHEIEVADGDIFLLCSDGLTHYLKDVEIGELLSNESELEVSLNLMTDLALERGGADNITTVALKIENQGGDR